MKSAVLSESPSPQKGTYFRQNKLKLHNYFFKLKLNMQVIRCNTHTVNKFEGRY